MKLRAIVAAGIGLLAAVTALGGGMLSGCSSGTTAATPAPTPPTTPAATVPHILFVGDSFTHGRYLPVRQYNSGGTSGATTSGSALVVDENYGQTGARAESSTETGPWGGIPGLFAQFAVEAGLGPNGTGWDVHIEAISSTSLGVNYTDASTVIAQPLWNAVVLQEISTRPLTGSLTGDATSDPANFCASVATIEKGVHAADTAAAASMAKMYLYETWPRADEAQTLAGSTTAPGFAAGYATALTTLGNAYHNVYYRAAALDGQITAVAPAGEAWTRAWAEGVAAADPYAAGSALPSLWYGINAVNNPAITSPDYLHPSVYGAYVSALVLFQQITGTDVRTLGGGEKGAAALGISSAIAVQLQQVAWETVTQESSAPVNETVDPCSLTS